MITKRKLARITAAAAVTTIYGAATVKAYNDDDVKTVAATAVALSALTWLAALL